MTRSPAAYLVNAAQASIVAVGDSVGVGSADAESDGAGSDVADSEGGRAFFEIANQVGIEYAMDNVDQLSLPAAPAKLLRLRSAVEGTARENLNQPQKETPP